MLKKFTWIVALLAALTIVIGCTNAGIDPEWDDPDKDFKKIDLIALDDDGEKVIFNTFAGQPEKQAGWATDGYIDDENGVTVESTLKVSDFTGARFLVIETAKNPTGGLHLVWQSKNFPDNGWKTQDKSVLADNSNANPGTTKKTGNTYGGATIRIDLPIALGTTYGNFLAATDFMRFVLAYYSPDLDGLDIQEAYLLISDKKSPISPELGGLYSNGLGQTNIRKSADEYGWQFSELVKTKQPKDTLPIADLRDAKYLVLATKGGGIGITKPTGGYKEISVILDAGSGNSFETIVGEKDVGISFAHKVDRFVFFVFELDKLIGYDDTVTAEKKKGGTGPDKDDPVPKFDAITLTVKYAPMEELGLWAAYFIEDDLTSIIPTVGTATKKLERTVLADTEEYGYISNDPDFKSALQTKIELPVVFGLQEKEGSLGDFTLKQSDNQLLWGFNGTDGELDWDLFTDAKYLVFETKGTAGNFGGIRFILQGNGDWGWNSTNPWGDWIKTGYTAAQTTYIVVDLTTLTKYTEVAGGTTGKIVIQYWDMVDLNLLDAYLIPAADASTFAASNFTGAGTYVVNSSTTVATDTDNDGDIDLDDASNGQIKTAPTAFEGYVTSSTSFGTALKNWAGF